MVFSRKRFSLAAGVATVALLALPALAGANPGSGPELVQRSGRLVVLHADRPGGSSTQQWMLVDGSDELRVRTPGDVWIEPGTRVRLEGTMHDGELVLADSLSAVERLGPAPLAADQPVAASGPVMHDTAVILFGFTGGPTSSAFGASANADAGTLMFGSAPSSLNSYYLEQTYNQLGFSGDVFGPFNIAGPPNCSLSGGSGSVWDWADQAISAAQLQRSYQHYVFVFPYVSACGGWSGLATVPGSYVWINGAFQVPVVAHELGHNLGLAHAAGLLCKDTVNATTAVAMGASCSTTGLEYADPFDAMGNAPVLRQMSMEHKLELNLVPAAGVQVVTTSGTYHLAPMELTPTTPEVLRIPRPGGGNYFVEYRQRLGYFDLQTPDISGVYIRTESPEVMQGAGSPNADTGLIDLHPGSASSPTWADAKMDPQQIFTDPLGGILIQDIAETPTDATLLITVPGAPPVAPPGTTGGGGSGATPPASGSATPTAPVPPTPPTDVSAKPTKDGEVLLAWRASSGMFGISGYRVLRDGREIANTSSTAYVDRTPQPGADSRVTYAVVAVDIAGVTSQPGTAPPLRAALLRALGASHLKAVRARSGKRKLVRVRGVVSDAEAVCRVRVAGDPWRPCKAAASGAFAVSLRARGKKPVTLSLRDELGRVKLQTLRVR